LAERETKRVPLVWVQRRADISEQIRIAREDKTENDQQRDQNAAHSERPKGRGPETKPLPILGAFRIYVRRHNVRTVPDHFVEPDRNNSRSVENTLAAQQIEPGIAVLVGFPQVIFQRVIAHGRQLWIRRVFEPVISELRRERRNWAAIEEKTHLLQPSIHGVLKALLAPFGDLLQCCGPIRFGQLFNLFFLLFFGIALSRIFRNPGIR